MDKHNRDSFILYGNQARQLEMLSNFMSEPASSEDAGALIKKVYRYVNGEDVGDCCLSPVAEMLYTIIEDQIIRDR